MFRKNVIQRTEGKTHNKSDCAQLPLGKMTQIHENVVFVCVIHAKTECLTLCYSRKNRVSYIVLFKQKQSVLHKLRFPDLE